MIELNRGEGPERVMQMAEDRAPEGFADVGDILSRAELETVADGYKRAAGFDREALNARGSLSPPGGSMRRARKTQSLSSRFSPSAKDRDP